MAKTSGLVPQFMDEPMEESTPLVPITILATIPPLLNEGVPEEKVVGYPSRDFHTPLSNHNG